MKRAPDGETEKPQLPVSNRWRLQDVKARLSEVLREARTNGPQHVTVRGRDAVVIVDAAEFARLRRPVNGRDIVDALRAAPSLDLEFERLSVKSPVRTTVL